MCSSLDSSAARRGTERRNDNKRTKVWNEQIVKKAAEMMGLRIGGDDLVLDHFLYRFGTMQKDRPGGLGTGSLPSRCTHASFSFHSKKNHASCSWILIGGMQPSFNYSLHHKIECNLSFQILSHKKCNCRHETNFSNRTHLLKYHYFIYLREQHSIMQWLFFNFYMSWEWCRRGKYVILHLY